MTGTVRDHQLGNEIDPGRIRALGRRGSTRLLAPDLDIARPLGSGCACIWGAREHIEDQSGLLDGHPGTSFAALAAHHSAVPARDNVTLCLSSIRKKRRPRYGCTTALYVG